MSDNKKDTARNSPQILGIVSGRVFPNPNSPSASLLRCFFSAVATPQIRSRTAKAVGRTINTLASNIHGKHKPVAVSFTRGVIACFRSAGGESMIDVRRPQTCFPAPINQSMVIDASHGGHSPETRH